MQPTDVITPGMSGGSMPTVSRGMRVLRTATHVDVQCTSSLHVFAHSPAAAEADWNPVTVNRAACVSNGRSLSPNPLTAAAKV